MSETDLVIVGAGPAGLFGAYYAGFRGLSVTVVDSLPELGGQVTALYPEKAIYDVAGFPVVTGRQLVAQLVEQAESAKPTYVLGRTATGLSTGEDGVLLTLDDGSEIHAKVAILTAGIGTFTPRALPAGDGWEGRGLVFFVPSFEEFRDKRVVIVGGGDSAFDWASALSDIAASVALVHRRDAFRAHAATVEAVKAGPTQIITNAQVTEIRGGDTIEEVDVTTPEGTQTLQADAVIAALGFIADLSVLKSWGLEFNKRNIAVDSAMRTNLPRVFAAGDLVEYDGKVRLIAVGFGEVATAVNNAAVVIDPDAHVFPGHSSGESA